jgi:hypothetical protein
MVCSLRGENFFREKLQVCVRKIVKIIFLRKSARSAGNKIEVTLKIIIKLINTNQQVQTIDQDFTKIKKG